MKTVVIMRGPSGSGKSYFVNTKLPSARWLSADHFFLRHEPAGKVTYEFNPTQIGEAHAWCFRKYMTALYDSFELIVIDNTNIRLWEMENYIYLAKQFNYRVEIITTMNPLQISVEELTRRNLHGVPQEIIQKMVDTYEPHPNDLNIARW